MEAKIITPTTLQKLKDWVSDDQKCLDLDPGYIKEEEICIGGTAKVGTGACHGDSGSAFQCKGTDGRFYQVSLPGNKHGDYLNIIFTAWHSSTSKQYSWYMCCARRTRYIHTCDSLCRLDSDNYSRKFTMILIINYPKSYHYLYYQTD